jgi:GNAT superfamily N-acetyltransferase
MQYRIREVNVSSREVREELTRLHKLCFADGEAVVPNFLNGWWWIAKEEGNVNPVGFAGMVRSRQYPEWMAYLIRVGVVPSARGHGLHSRLIKARELKARKVGITCLVTDTHADASINSSNNLAKAGFKIYTPENPWALKRSIYWRKALG